MNKNAQVILDIINASTEHLTAEQIYRKLIASSSKMVLATVYNNLTQLCAQGLIRRVSTEGYPDRYDKIIRHDHLVCKKCGKLKDIFLKDLTEQLQPQIKEEWISYDLKIHYICQECQKKEQ